MPWKVVSILWPILIAALLPLDLNEIADRLPNIMHRLDALDAMGTSRADKDRSRPRKVEGFRQRYADYIGTPA